MARSPSSVPPAPAWLDAACLTVIKILACCSNNSQYFFLLHNVIVHVIFCLFSYPVIEVVMIIISLWNIWISAWEPVPKYDGMTSPGQLKEPG